jgi:hypothetical protein
MRGHLSGAMILALPVVPAVASAAPAGDAQGRLSNLESASVVVSKVSPQSNAPVITNRPRQDARAENPRGGQAVRTFTWRDVVLPEYTNYLAALRAAGCPEAHVRQIVVSDVNEFFDQQRLHEAMQYDFEWWKPIPPSRAYLTTGSAADGRLDRLRAAYFTRFLGPQWAEVVKAPPLSSCLAFHLTGPVLGALPLSRFSTVVEICEASEKRMREYQAARFSQGEPIDLAEEARLRQQTRTELSRVLTPEEMEEFLIRNSHNAETLRGVLQPFQPSREEFRKIFAALDPIQHRMQSEYGSEGALSARQRDEYERQGHRAVQEVLSPERFEAYLMAVDACFRRAQADAQKAGLDAAARLRLWEFYRTQSARRSQVMQDAARTPEQKSQALLVIAAEEQKRLAELVNLKGPTAK